MYKKYRVLFVVAVAGVAAACTSPAQRQREAQQSTAAPAARAAVQPMQAEFASSPRVPSAEGTVKTSDAGNNNTGIDVQVKHLARPQKLDPSATTYVVWARPLGDFGRPQSLGALSVDQELTGRLSGTTAFRDFEVFITAESSAQVQDPRGERLLWATVTQR